MCFLNKLRTKRLAWFFSTPILIAMIDVDYLELKTILSSENCLTLGDVS